MEKGWRTVLKIENMNVYYGAIQAVHDLSMEVEEGQIVTLIGANGAGKTSTLRAISGLNQIRSGTIVYQGENIANMKPNRIVAKGISQVPEGRRAFGNQTVYENLMLGAYLHKDKRTEEVLEQVYGYFPRIKERRNQLAGTLSGGEQQMLVMGRALMSRPKLLLLDEPSMGLAPIIVEEVFQIIKNIQKNGTTILLVEQNANAALQISDKGYVLENGRVVLSGRAEELLKDEQVKKAYLGI